MKETFKKQQINEKAINESYYVKLFAEYGFEAKRVEISFKNGCSAYIRLNVNVLNENKMPGTVFVYEGKAMLTVRISDHSSNIERVCGGSCGDKISFTAFKKLALNNVIENAK